MFVEFHLLVGLFCISFMVGVVTGIFLDDWSVRP